MTSLAWKLQTIPSLPFAENTYVAHLEGRTDCLVVDPGTEPHKIIDYLQEAGLTPAAILITHGHGDHIAGNAELKQHWPDCPLVIGTGDAPLLTDPKLNMSAGFGFDLISPPADVMLNEGDMYEAAGFRLLVLNTPGHSPGHVVFVWQDQTPAQVFGGDVLFAGSIGRTDLPGQSGQQLLLSIHDKLFKLPDDTVVYPGHGPRTTIGKEKRTNPFVGLPASLRRSPQA
ncbi:MAG: MBL fold metallo-hydrolase [Pirellulales bacterium]